MTLDVFMHSLADAVDNGQAYLANTLRALVYQADPELFDVLEDADPDVFLEPLLFAHFAVKQQPSVPLSQIVVGYVDAAMRPDAMQVRSDAAGTIYLPRIGYFLTGARDRTLLLLWDEETGHASLLDDDTPIDFRFEKLPRIPGTNIEICCQGVPMLADVIAESTAQGADFRVLDECHGHVDHLATAMEIIRAQWPAYHALIQGTVRQVVLFQSATLESFATMSAHGIACLNVNAGDDEVFFVADLLHQCGHVMFNAATARNKEYVAVDPDTPIRSFNGDPKDDRSVYVVLHGMFTELAMVHVLRLCDERAVFSGRKAHELTGRLAFITHKALSDMASLGHESLLTAKGRSLYETFVAVFESTRRERADLLAGYTMANQPYSFSYEVFARLNPMPQSTA